MKSRTKIQWTDFTFNPWRGCTKKSPGCLHCYAEQLSHRNPAVLGEWGPGRPRVLASDAMWREPVKWQRFQHWCPKCGTGIADPETLGNPYVCPECDSHVTLDHRNPRVFTASLSDWLDPEVQIEWLARLLDTIRQTPNLDWLLLTKRPENWKARLRKVWLRYAAGNEDVPADTGLMVHRWVNGLETPNNVWLGVSAEDQERWDERVPTLLNIPAAVRFVSVEPMLAPIDMRLGRPDGVPAWWRGKLNPLSRLDWIILGGESGPKARPCNVAWIRGGVRQCREASVACFVKQLGARCVTDDSSDPHFHAGQAMVSNPKGGDPAEWPEDLRVREWPEGMR